MAEDRKCIICGSKEHNIFCTATDYTVSKETFTLLQCSSCGFIFTADPPDERDMGEYYLSEDYISHTDRKKGIVEIFYHYSRAFMLRRKRRLVISSCNNKKGSLIDIGSGTGYFPASMQKNGWEVMGVEISERARQYSIKRFNIDCIPPDRVNKIPDNHFDCVTLWHVLEHFNDPGSWLTEIYRIMKDDGKCILALPNIISSDALWFRDKWAALDVPRHLWHFSPEMLKSLISKYGFRLKCIRPLPLDLFYISILSYKNQAMSLPLLRGVFTGAILSIRNIFSAQKASSLIYIIEKEAL